MNMTVNQAGADKFSGHVSNGIDTFVRIIAHADDTVIFDKNILFADFVREYTNDKTVFLKSFHTRNPLNRLNGNITGYTGSLFDFANLNKITVVIVDTHFDFLPCLAAEKRFPHRGFNTDNIL